MKDKEATPLFGEWHVEQPKGEGPVTHPYHSWFRVVTEYKSTVAYVVGEHEANEMVDHHNDFIALISVGL